MYSKQSQLLYSKYFEEFVQSHLQKRDFKKLFVNVSLWLIDRVETRAKHWNNSDDLSQPCAGNNPGSLHLDYRWTDRVLQGQGND